MLRTLAPVAHATVHRLAAHTGCRCPDCGCGAPSVSRMLSMNSFEDYDEAARRRRRGRRAYQPVRAPAGYRAALQQTLRTMGWSGFRAPAAQPVTMQDLRTFQARGGVQQVTRGRRRYMQLTDAGRRMLAQPGAFQRLAPLFQDQPGADIYQIGGPGGAGRPSYVGKTNRAPGLRLIEHLMLDQGRAGQQLRQLQQRGQLDQLTVSTGRFTAPDRGRRSHLGEVALMELLNPAWNDPARHGFEDAGEHGWPQTFAQF